MVCKTPVVEWYLAQSSDRMQETTPTDPDASPDLVCIRGEFWHTVTNLPNQYPV